MDFQDSYPPLIYEVAEGKYDVYAPPIPAKADESSIYPADIPKVGLYPDKVVKSIAGQRDRFEKELYEVCKEVKAEKINGKEQMRLADMWREKYLRVQEYCERNHERVVRDTDEDVSGGSSRTDSEDNLRNGAMD